MKTTLALVLAFLAPLAAHAAEDGQLWEVSSKMEMPDMPDMPAGMGPMGGQTMRMCQGDDPRETITKNKEMSDCEIKDLKQTDTTVSMTAICKKGRSAKMEIVYNKARTEYKGTMLMKDGDDEMTMRMTGKKIGSCDAKKARAEMTAKIEKHKAQAENAEAQYKAMTKKAESDQIKGCDKALDKMDPSGFSFYGNCYKNKKDASCKSLMSDFAKQQPKVATSCTAKIEAFCERYETPGGFFKVGDESRLEMAGRMCGKSPEDLRPKLCRVANKSESFEFLGAHCPDLAKPLAKKHCAGRSYTVKEGDPRRVEKKWFKFCVAVAGSNLGGDAEEQTTHAPTPKDMKDAAKKEAKEASKKAAKDAAVGALKGLFGR